MDNLHGMLTHCSVVICLLINTNYDASNANKAGMASISSKQYCMATMIGSMQVAALPCFVQFGALHCVIQGFFIVAQVHVANCSIEIGLGIVRIVLNFLVKLPTKQDQQLEMSQRASRHPACKVAGPGRLHAAP